eukprot:gene2596-3217_t
MEELLIHDSIGIHTELYLKKTYNMGKTIDKSARKFKVTPRTYLSWVKKTISVLNDLVKNKINNVKPVTPIEYEPIQYNFVDCPDILFVAPFAIDTTFIQVEKPTDFKKKEAIYSGKHKSHGMKFETVVTWDRKLIFVSGPYEGKVHDKKISDESGVLNIFQHPILGDKAYEGSTNIVSPVKKKR